MNTTYVTFKTQILKVESNNNYQTASHTVNTLCLVNYYKTLKYYTAIKLFLCIINMPHVLLL